MSKDKFAKGALLGALFGAVLGLLYAPSTGEQTRKKLKEEADKLKNNPKVKDALKEVEKFKNTTEVKQALKEVDKLKKQVTPIVKKNITTAKKFINKAATKTKAATDKKAK